MNILEFQTKPIQSHFKRLNEDVSTDIKHSQTGCEDGLNNLVCQNLTIND